jgi:4'-phosphopantetheinyl transferase
VRDVDLPGLSLASAGAKGVRVWAADLDVMPPSAPAASLSPDERARAARYRLPRDRARFEKRRRWLRQVLGACLGRPPAEVGFTYGAHGQPAVAGCAGFHFSLSHAGGRVLCAVAADRRIGADLAHVRPGAADDAVARALFAPGEIAGLRALPAGARAAAFHRCWTRKEAFVKARGEGLSVPLDAFEVSLSAEPITTLVRSTLDSRETTRWTFVLLEPFPACVGSIAVEAPT